MKRISFSLGALEQLSCLAQEMVINTVAGNWCCFCFRIVVEFVWVSRPPPPPPINSSKSSMTFRCLFVRLFACLPVGLFVWLLVCLCVRLCVDLYVYMSCSLLVCSYICLPSCWLVWLFALFVLFVLFVCWFGLLGVRLCG